MRYKANQTSRRDAYFLDKVKSNDREIERIREYIAPRIAFLNRNKGIDNADIRETRKQVNENAQRIRDLKAQSARILANARNHYA
jgi:hypothetical protein